MALPEASLFGTQAWRQDRAGQLGALGSQRDHRLVGKDECRHRSVEGDAKALRQDQTEEGDGQKPAGPRHHVVDGRGRPNMLIARSTHGRHRDRRHTDSHADAHDQKGGQHAQAIGRRRPGHRQKQVSHP
jgi:hypothetical protein